MIIAIDGPAGSGKSTQAKLLAERLSFSYLDTGAMYRILTAKALAQGVSFEDESALVWLASTIRFALFKTLIIDEFLDIRSREVDQAVSLLARNPAVRRRRVSIQRKLIQSKNVVLEGRDAATVIAPRADVKIFLTASEGDRIHRRKNELAGRGEFRSDEEVRRSILERDELDTRREASPLRPAKGAIILDTTGLSIEETSLKILKLCNHKTHRVNLLYQVLKAIGLVFVMPFYFRFKSRNREHIPKKGGFIFASNHRSHLDPMLLGFASPRRLSFMARESLFWIPLFGWFIHSLNANPIKRGHADLGALRLGLYLLFEGRGLVIFPEGTRSKTGEMGDEKPGVAMLALRSGVPIIPAWIEGSQNAMPKGSKIIKPARITVTLGPQVELNDLLKQPLARANYDEALARIMQAIRNLKSAGGARI